MRVMVLAAMAAMMSAPALADRPIMSGEPPWVRNNWITHQENQARALRAAPPRVMCEVRQGYAMMSTNGRCGVPEPGSGRMPSWPPR